MQYFKKEWFVTEFCLLYIEINIWWMSKSENRKKKSNSNYVPDPKFLASLPSLKILNSKPVQTDLFHKQFESEKKETLKEKAKVITPRIQTESKKEPISVNSRTKKNKDQNVIPYLIGGVILWIVIFQFVPFGRFLSAFGMILKSFLYWGALIGFFIVLFNRK